MNAVSAKDQPLGGTVSSNSASRRTFLKGAGLAGAAGLASAAGLTAPFLATTSARASTGIILGCQAPSAWDGDGVPGWQSQVYEPSENSGSFALGCRSYRDTMFNLNGSNGFAPFTDPGALGNPPTFPGESGSIPLASIRPDPTSLLNGYLDSPLIEMITDGISKASSGYFQGTPQLTVWHEAGHLYNTTDGPLDGALDAVEVNGVPTNGTNARTARLMHQYMQNLVTTVNSTNAGPNVEYGCIIYGDVNKMANDNDLQGPTNWVPTAADGPLDWYGIDLYYEGDGAGSDCTHPDLSTWALVNEYMNNFWNMAVNRANGSALRINVCECNASASDDSARPEYFENLANWLYNNNGYRMLTFFPDPAGTHSVTWPYVAGPNSAGYTLAALNTIQSNYGR